MKAIVSRLIHTYVHLVHAYGYGIVSMSTVVSVMIVIVIVRDLKIKR